MCRPTCASFQSSHDLDVSGSRTREHSQWGKGEHRKAACGEQCVDWSVNGGSRRVELWAPAGWQAQTMPAGRPSELEAVPAMKARRAATSLMCGRAAGSCAQHSRMRSQ